MRLSRRSTRLLRLAFWGASLFAFVMAIWPLPVKLPGDPSDKVQHIIAFATLASLGSAAYQRWPLIRLGIGLSAFGALIEIVQLIPALNRDGDVVDWIADTLATSLVLALAALLRRRGGNRGT